MKASVIDNSLGELTVANVRAELDASIAQRASVPVEVLDASGVTVTSGHVQPTIFVTFDTLQRWRALCELSQGSHRVVVHNDADPNSAVLVELKRVSK